MIIITSREEKGELIESFELCAHLEGVQLRDLLALAFGNL